MTALGTLVLEIPWPPTANTYYRATGKAGHPIRRSNSGVIFGKNVEAAVIDALAGRVPRIKTPCAVVLELWSSEGTGAWDVDNRIKPVLDALERVGVLENDRVVRAVLAVDKGVCEGGRCRVTISEDLIWDRPET